MTVIAAMVVAMEAVIAAVMVAVMVAVEMMEMEAKVVPNAPHSKVLSAEGARLPKVVDVTVLIYPPVRVYLMTIGHSKSGSSAISVASS